MALINCKGCGHLISEKALRCPKCGYTNQMEYNDSLTSGTRGKKGISKSAIMMLVLVTLVILGTASFYYYKQNTTQMDKETAISIFQDIVGTTPVQCIFEKEGGVEKIYGLLNKGVIGGHCVFSELEQVSGAWQVVQTQDLFDYDWEHHFVDDDFGMIGTPKESLVKIQKIKGEKFLFFVHREYPSMACHTCSSLHFSLLSLGTLQYWNLKFEGQVINVDVDNRITGNFTNQQELPVELLHFLEKEASLNTVIYRPQGKDLDIYDKSNFSKKWKLDNQKYLENPFQLETRCKMVITMYDEAIFDFSDYEAEHIVENEKYKIVYKESGSVLGYNKTKQKYFPIWINECTQGCEKKVSFLGENILAINYWNDNTFEINLDNMTVERKIIPNHSIADIVIADEVEEFDNDKDIEYEEEFEKILQIPNEEEEEEEEEELIFTVVEQMPEFPGGKSNLLSFLSQNVKYPSEAQTKGIQGRVTCSFVVNRDGSITDVEVVHSVNTLLDKEAIRVINSMPKWIPGKNKGRFIRVKHTVPITFRLQ